jgi:hypothetical protein
MLPVKVLQRTASVSLSLPFIRVRPLFGRKSLAPAVVRWLTVRVDPLGWIGFALSGSIRFRQ